MEFTAACEMILFGGKSCHSMKFCATLYLYTWINYWSLAKLVICIGICNLAIMFTVCDKAAEKITELISKTDVSFSRFANKAGEWSAFLEI